MLKYKKDLMLTDSVGAPRSSDRQESGDNTGFFSAPLLHVESITYSDEHVEIGSSYNSDYTVCNPQKFECQIWRSNIGAHSRNPAFSILNECSADTYITTIQGESTSLGARLLWKNMKKPPTHFVTNGGPLSREEYEKVVASFYGTELRRNYGSPTIDIRKGVTSPLYFLLTFKESSYAYLLTMSEFATCSDNKDVLYDSIDSLSLALPLDSQYTFDIRFYGKNRGGKVRLKLDIKSRDKILLLP
ncbi:MAG: hypothetical protein WAZ77_04645 [Candidatus Nitrosopolaris sp.]|jgi:hypothetical protein